MILIDKINIKKHSAKKRFYYANMPILKSKNLIIFLTLAALIVVVSGCLKRPPKPPVNTNQNVNQNTNTATSTADSLINDLKTQYFKWFGSSNIDKSTVYWRRSDDYLMALSGGYRIEANLDLGGAEVRADGEDQLLNNIKQFFTQRKFVINEKNSPQEIVHGNFYDYYSLGFEKNIQKCTINWTDGLSLGSRYYFIACASYKDIDEKYYQEFHQLFNSKDLYWHVSKYSDNFAMGNSEAVWWMAKKIDGRWVKIVSSQEDPLCSVLEKYDVPDSFYVGQCWEDGGASEKTWVNN